MDKYQQRVSGALRRGKWFLGVHAALIGAEAGPAVAELDAAIVAMNADAVEKSQAKQLATSGTVSKNVLRQRLRELMGPVAAIAGGGLIGGVPVGELQKFRYPDAKVSDVALIAAARAMAGAAARYRQAFEAIGRPSGFVEGLEGAAHALEQRIIERDGDRVNGRRAGLGIAMRVRKARALLTLLTRVINERLYDRPDLVGAWRTAIRIKRVAGATAEPEDLAQAA